MWAKLKALPLAAKVAIGAFLVLLVYGATHQPSDGPGSNDGALSSGPGGRGGRQPADGGGDAKRLLQQYEEQYAAVMAELQKKNAALAPGEKVGAAR